MDWEVCGRNCLCSNLNDYLGICKEGLRKFTRNLSEVNLCPGEDSNRSPPEYRLDELSS
jgi:hypothetical protein